MTPIIIGGSEGSKQGGSKDLLQVEQNGLFDASLIKIVDIL